MAFEDTKDNIEQPRTTSFAVAAAENASPKYQASEQRGLIEKFKYKNLRTQAMHVRGVLKK